MRGRLEQNVDVIGSIAERSPAELQLSSSHTRAMYGKRRDVLAFFLRYA